MSILTVVALAGMAIFTAATLAGHDSKRIRFSNIR
jgi:hypothetical protein